MKKIPIYYSSNLKRDLEGNSVFPKKLPCFIVYFLFILQLNDTAARNLDDNQLDKLLSDINVTLSLKVQLTHNMVLVLIKKNN